jgi:hypothetical protein
MAKGVKARKGLKYEAKVHDYFLGQYGLRYFPGQWWMYGTGTYQTAPRYCQTDGLWIDEARRRLVLLEVKYSHTASAYWQMENLYVPVLQRYFGKDRFALCTVEVVKWYDCAIACPRRPVLRESLEDVRPGEFAVHILNRE